LGLPLISAANAEGERAFFGGSSGENRRFSKGRKAIFRATAAAAQVARLRQHSEGYSFATSYRGPWKLIYYEAYLEQADALGRERYLKSGAGRRFLQSQLKNYLRKHPSKETA
jgi:predicted GIY-YIG superfamily endonuclease